jgi:hypothetical protein
MVEWMGRNLDDFSGFRKFLAMRNITLYINGPVTAEQCGLKSVQFVPLL